MVVSDPTYVVLADVIGSRDLADRAAFRHQLEHTLDAINEAHRDDLVAPFEPIKGIDEFGAVIKRLGPLIDMLGHLHRDLHPARLRLSVASGEIDVGDPAQGIASMDGPAFHRAERLSSRIERDDLYVGLDTGSLPDPLVETTVNLLVMHWERRTDRQREIVDALERHGTQRAAAEELDITHQAVSDTLQRIEYHRLETIGDRLRSACEELYD